MQRPGFASLGVGLFFFVATTSAAGSAFAEPPPESLPASRPESSPVAPLRAERAGPSLVPHIVVTAEGPEGATLEQRDRATGSWTSVCSLPCKAEVRPTPLADLHILDGDIEVPVRLRGEDGEHFVVRYSRAHKSARSSLVTIGALTGAAGMLFFTIGVVRGLGQLGGGHEVCRASADEACERRQEKADDERSTARTMVYGGAISMLVGSIVIVSGVLVGRSSLETSTSLPPTASAVRVPTWTGPSLPKPPPAYAQLVNVSF